MHIWTDNPLREIWNQLRYLKSPVNVENLLTGRIRSSRSESWPPTEALKQHAYEISCSIKQADEYFHASQEVGLATKPLLQFYGAQALAKAAILANDPKINLGLLKYHGLQSRPSTAELRNYSDKPDAWKIETEFAVTNDGVFLHLSRVAGDSIPEKGKVIRFQEIIRIIPDLSKLYMRHYGEPSHCLYLYGEPEIGDDGYFSVFFSGTEISAVRQVFPEFSSGYQESVQ